MAVPARVQLDGPNVPVELEAKLTVPVGVLAVPAEMSATVAEQVRATPTVPEAGHETVSEVSRRVTATVTDVKTDCPAESVVIRVTLYEARDEYACVIEVPAAA